PLSALICENDYRFTSCGKLLPGGIEQPALYSYDRIAFSCFHFVKLIERTSQAVLHPTTGIVCDGLSVNRQVTGSKPVRGGSKGATCSGRWPFSVFTWKISSVRRSSWLKITPLITGTSFSRCSKQ